MDDLNQQCQICLESFNKTSQKKIPKILPCCNQTICLECLEDIYKRNNNTILCPVCRQILNQNPSSFITNNNVYEGFLKCLSCNRDVTKTELYLNFGDTLNLKCCHCQKDDLPLDDFLPSYLLELNSFIQEFSNKESLIQKVDTKIGDFLDLFYKEIKENIIYKARLKVIEEIKMKLDYDIKNDYEKFIMYLNILKEKYDYLNSFTKDDTNKKFNSEDIIDDMNFYVQKSETIRKASEEYLKISKFINENNLIDLNDKVNKNEFGDFFVKLFKFPLSNIQREDDFLTGIKLFDDNIMKKIEEIKSKNQSINVNNINLNFNNNDLNNNNLNENNNNLNKNNLYAYTENFNEKKDFENINFTNNLFNESDKKNQIYNINDDIDFGRKESEDRFKLIPKSNDNDMKTTEGQNLFDFDVTNPNDNKKEDQKIENEKNKEKKKKLKAIKIEEKDDLDEKANEDDDDLLPLFH